MKRQELRNLTTSERLTLLEQIFAPQGRLEFASCSLSNLDYMFDFEDVNLEEMRWTSDEGDLREIIEHTKHLLSPDAGQKFGLGVHYFVHSILPQEPITVQRAIDWFKHDEPIAIDHFVSATDASNDITLRIVFINNEISEKIYDEVFKNNRIVNN